MASRSASRTVIVTISVPAGTSGSAAVVRLRAPRQRAPGPAAALAPPRRCAAPRSLVLRLAQRASLAGAAASRLDRRRVLAVRQDHRDRRVDRDVGGAFGDQDLAERALVDRLDLHGRLVGLDLGDDVAGLDRVALVLEPLGEVALLHRGRQRGHENFDRHVTCSMLNSRAYAHHVGVQLGRVRLRIVGGEFRRLVDDAAHLGVDLLELVFARALALDQARRAPARSDRARCASSRLPRGCGISPGPTSNGRDSGRSAFPG